PEAALADKTGILDAFIAPSPRPVCIFLKKFSTHYLALDWGMKRRAGGGCFLPAFCRTGLRCFLKTGKKSHIF
ncbi:MAG: hypothetical protein WCS42_28000, partial [Verrucomicrobiota bacterium]